ncbi:MAG: hypothetical protein AVDCRST_MAG30-266, partial [uncultured Solirubrobacteraceae bacterium]
DRQRHGQAPHVLRAPRGARRARLHRDGQVGPADLGPRLRGRPPGM